MYAVKMGSGSSVLSAADVQAKKKEQEARQTADDFFAAVICAVNNNTTVQDKLLNNIYNHEHAALFSITDYCDPESDEMIKWLDEINFDMERITYDQVAVILQEKAWPCFWRQTYTHRFRNGPFAGWTLKVNHDFKYFVIVEICKPTWC